MTSLNFRNIGSDICALLDAPRSYPGLQRRCRLNYPRLTPGVRELIQPVSDVERDFAETKPLLVRRLKFIERPLMAQSGRSDCATQSGFAEKKCPFCGCVQFPGVRSRGRPPKGGPSQLQVSVRREAV